VDDLGLPFLSINTDV